MPAALIRHLYAPSPPVWAVGNEGYRLFDDPDGVAMGSHPARKLNPFAIAYLIVVVREKIEIEAHWYFPMPPSRHKLSLEHRRKVYANYVDFAESSRFQRPPRVSIRLSKPLGFYLG